MSRRRWRTKVAADLMAATGAKDIEQAIVSLAAVAKRDATAAGFLDGTSRAPYDPVTLAMALGAKEVRPAELGFDGHVAGDGTELVVEYDVNTRSSKRRRFTIAHEAGHLALMRVTGFARKLPARRSPRGSEIEELCNRFAAEVLAPRAEVHELWRSVQCKGSAPSRCSFVALVSQRFDVSLSVAALRFREVCASSSGAALVNCAERQFEWCHSMPAPARLFECLMTFLPSDREAGVGSLPVDAGIGMRMVAFEWKRISDHHYLVMSA